MDQAKTRQRFAFFDLMAAPDSCNSTSARGSGHNRAMSTDGERPTRSHVARRSFEASTQAGRAFLQSRICDFARVMFIAMAAYFVFMVVGHQYFEELVPHEHVFGIVLVAVALSGVGSLWWYTSGPLRSERMVKWLDLACAVDPSALMAVSAYIMRDLPVASFGAYVGVSMMIFGRALIVPSTAQRTALVSTMAVMPLLGVVGYLAYTSHQSLLLPAAMQVSLFAMWSAIAVALTTYGSGIIYGLREQVREARQLGQYTLVEKLGEGGMGVVYRAQHSMLRRPTAVKLLPPEKSGEQQLERFEREVQHTAELSHPNTVHIYDYGRSPDGVFYYAMEFLHGVDLERLVDKYGSLPPARVVHIMQQICGSLAEAHERGLVHRDIKPANIYLCERGGISDVVKVLDFGLVKELKRDGANLTDVNVVAGTPAFLSPEAITSPDDVGPAADLYAVGGVAYFLLTGEMVFDGATVAEVCGHHVHSQPEPPSSRIGESLDDELESVVLSCLAKDPAQRPPSARELKRRFGRIVDLSRWNDEKARGWWEREREKLGSAQPSKARTGFATTMAVDLRERGQRA